jgi:hypothetical protein
MEIVQYPLVSSTNTDNINNTSPPLKRRTEIMPIKSPHSQTRAKPLPLAIGHGRYPLGNRYCTPEQARLFVGKWPLHNSSGLDPFPIPRCSARTSITTPITSALKNHYTLRFLGVPTDILNHFWIQVAVSHLKVKPPHGSFRSETAVT